MCGIIGGTAHRDVTPVLLEGLRRLEYRGYDSAGIAVINKNNRIERQRVTGKVEDLARVLRDSSISGTTGIAHTRWATHGKPSEKNAHPHVCRDEFALVHNGIIENYESLKQSLVTAGYDFQSDTDTEVIVNQIHAEYSENTNFLESVFSTLEKLSGAYAIGVISNYQPDRLIAARRGSPLIIGVGIEEYFIASDVIALLPVTRQLIFLEDGDVADISCDGITIFNSARKVVERPVTVSDKIRDVSDKSGYRHFMLKEIFEQPRSVIETLAHRIDNYHVEDSEFGQSASAVFDQIKSIKIVACGTSFHAGLVARYWAESLADIPCDVEIASEYRYRKPVVTPGTLFVTISQSGETADTLAALNAARQQGYVATLAICNVPESSLTREADLVFMTRAGIEIGVASTKAFTTQLVALLLLVVAIGRRNSLESDAEKIIIEQLQTLPGRINAALELNDKIRELAEQFINKQHALYLGRGIMLPIAMEGALKLKEISYIHAEAYAAGELKHGPLALVDEQMPVITIASNNELLEKIKSNMQEVSARGGKLYVFTDSNSGIESTDGIEVLKLEPVNDNIAPILFTVPLQLLAYHIAVLKGADVDQPRNLAKAVTVE